MYYGRAGTLCYADHALIPRGSNGGLDFSKGFKIIFCNETPFCQRRKCQTHSQLSSCMIPHWMNEYSAFVMEGDIFSDISYKVIVIVTNTIIIMIINTRSATVWLWHPIFIDKEHDAHLRHFLRRLHELQQQCCMWQWRWPGWWLWLRARWSLQMVNVGLGWDNAADDYWAKTDHKLNSILLLFLNLFVC